MRTVVSLVLTVLVLGSAAMQSQAQDALVWGDDSDGQVSNAPAGTGFTGIAAGGYHGYALRTDGSITAWGRDADGQGHFL